MCLVRVDEFRVELELQEIIPEGIRLVEMANAQIVHYGPRNAANVNEISNRLHEHLGLPQGENIGRRAGEPRKRSGTAWNNAYPLQHCGFAIPSEK